MNISDLNRPMVVTLCGSTRFKEEYQLAYFQETMAGKIVLSVGCFGHSDGIELTEDRKSMLDELHLRKIDISDEILVIDVLVNICDKCKTIWPITVEGVALHMLTCRCGGQVGKVRYIGQSTRNEINYATSKGKVVRDYTDQDYYDVNR